MQLPVSEEQVILCSSRQKRRGNKDGQPMTEDLGNNAVFTPGGLSDGPPIGDVEREAVSSLGGYPMLLGHC